MKLYSLVVDGQEIYDYYVSTRAEAERLVSAYMQEEPGTIEIKEVIQPNIDAQDRA